jgi:hypothetical protein
MGYLKAAVETTLTYAEQAKIPDYVASIRKSFKPADSMVAQVEALAATHGAPLVTKIDCKLDPYLEPVVDVATEKYGMYKEKCFTVVESAKTKKDSVVSYAQEKKEGVISKVKDVKEKASAAKEDIVRQVKTGELETTILKKAEKAEWMYTAWLVENIIGYKGKLVLNAKTIKTKLQTMGTAQLELVKAYAKELEGKLPIEEVKAKVDKLTAFVTTKSSPYVAMVTPYYTSAKNEFFFAKAKVLSKITELKETYMAKKTA